MGDWHPILAAVEYEPGHWRMVAQYDELYGEVAFVRRGDELGYRGDDANGQLVGYYRTLSAACMAVHRVWLRYRGASETPRYPYAPGGQQQQQQQQIML